MIRILLIILFVQFALVLTAQQKIFIINGEIEGEQKFKNAFLFDNNYKQIGKQHIVNGLFLFSGHYFPEQPDEFGELGLGTLLLSNQDTIINEESLYSGKPLVRMLIMEPNINVKYLTASGKFLVKGGILNEFQNLIYENEYLFKNKRDSVYSVVDLQIKDDGENKKEKSRVHRILFLQQKSIEFGLIEKHKNSKVALFNFNGFTLVPILPLEKCRILYESFPDSIKFSKYGMHTQILLTELEKQIEPNLKVKDHMPDFELVDLNGKVIKSINSLNKYTLIDFWASWCAPCRAENPNLKLAYQKYHNKGFNIISISIDAEKDKAKWLAAIAQDKTQEFINLYNPGGSSGIAMELGINAIPANYLIDGKGIVVGVNLRGSDLQKKLNKLFVK